MAFVMPHDARRDASAREVPEGVDDAELLRRFPTSSIDHDNKEFYRGLLSRQLLVNRCIDCDLLFFPPRSLCPECWGTGIVPAQVSGRGSVVLATTSGLARGGVRSETADETLEGEQVLVAVALIEQPDVRLSAPLVQCPFDQVQLGMEVEVSWLVDEGHPLPVFRPVM